MGVPAFFRWLCKKYPSIVVNAVEEKAQTDPYSKKKVPIDTTKPNPNGIEFDNLYLDMNGIIHPCTHPEDRPAPKNEDEMMVIIFEFLDRLFSIVRPRKLLYMAIDGVAPRAKMNQQRSRRFRAAKDTFEKQSEIKRLRQQIVANGGVVPPETPNEERFDSNCITPGTPFMHKLAECLRYYVNDRLNNDPGWKNLKVILSDASVPGEGEHKIMDFIRRQRANPNHDPNTHHVLCGADADLIMLGLATHEVNFTIIREEFRADRPRPCEICNQFGHETKDCTGCVREKRGEHDELASFVPTECNYIFLRLPILREYLQRELTIPNLPFKFEFERALDDWVFMCFFVGNDFLPHLPSLEIREGAIDRLVNLYKSMLPRLGGYLTEDGIVNLGRTQIILNGIGEVEDDIFKKRQANELEFQRRQKERKDRTRPSNSDNMPNRMPEWMKSGPYAPTPLIKNSAHIKIAAELNPNNNEIKCIAEEITIEKRAIKRKHEQDDSNRNIEDKKMKEDDNVLGNDDEIDIDKDPVRLWEDGWRQRYYKIKFDVSENDEEFRYTVAKHYAIGLSWVLRYYYQGVPAWNWYFPYHYAPFASDFKDLDKINENFDSNTEPFKPFEQLMAVFPAASKKHIPIVFQSLMTDINSVIIDFYPEDFRIDLNGKKQSWQGVALLPFVDEKRLKNALQPYYNKLNAEEIKRNQRGSDCLFISKSNLLYGFLNQIYSNKNTNKIEIQTKLSGGIAGKIWIDDNYTQTTIFYSPINYLCPDLKNNYVLSVRYKDPEYDSKYKFKACLLKGATLPEATLKPQDYPSGQNYRPNLGFTNTYGTYRQNKDSTVANRLLNNTLGINRPQYSSAYGGQSSVYGTYRSYTNSNNEQVYRNPPINQYSYNYEGDYNRNMNPNYNRTNSNNNNNRGTNYNNNNPNYNRNNNNANYNRNYAAGNNNNNSYRRPNNN